MALIVVSIAATLLASPSASATPMVSRPAALPAAPWDCKDAPVPAMPDSGLPGFFDPAPSPAPAAGDPWANPPTSTIYDQYGYAGLTWNTYDLGCMGAAGDLGATIDTFIGNLFLSGGTWIASGSNGIHNKIAHPETYMQPLDDVVATVTDRLHDAIWSPWGALALLGVAALLLVYSLHGRLSAVVTASAWALLVLAVLSGITAYPTRVAGFFDQTVTQTIGAVNQASAGITTASQTKTDPGRAQGALLVDQILYDAWLRGQFGDSHSAAATKWGPTLYRESAFSRAEVAAAAGKPDGIKTVTEQKQNDWIATTQEIQDADPSVYAQVQGKAKGRAGAGLLAFLGVLFAALFRLVADLFLFTGLVMLRMLVMFFPAAAVVGVIAPMSSIVRRIGNMAGASIVNVTAFAIGSTVHTIAISAILTHSTTPQAGILALILCLVVSVAAFILLLPLLSLTNILGHATGPGNQLLRWGRRAGTGYLVGRKATRDALEDTEHEPTPTTTPTPGGNDTTYPRETGPARYVRRVNLPPEAVGRPADDPAERVTDQPPVSEHERAVTPGHAPRAALSAAKARNGESTATSSQPIGGAGSVSQPSRDRLYDPATSSRRGGALVGALVDEVPPGTRELHTATRHDSNDEITSEGVVTRFYDPDTKTTVTSEQLETGERHD
ncbi:MAG: hypothetical protein L0H79_08985 [Intrasporangium sp.]|uniref:hypothetical protein n=1 Tax=Intrasporangium sp. TaxID=1925024 RepID=UPI00264A1ED6|nr:hypothetical protein [Intrasporangium sp.]MDN5795870.1 hypothetical protein [Intrasporangium sp.]